MFRPVVAPDVKLVHILLRITCVVYTIRIECEKVIYIHRVITPRLIIGACGRSGYSGIAAISHDRTPFGVFSFLRGYKHDSERSTRTINGRRRSVFEHGDRLYILGIDFGHIPLHPVNEDKRSSSIYRVVASDIDFRDICRRTACGRHIHSRDSPLENMGKRR